MFSLIFANWKTTIVGVATAIVTGLVANHIILMDIGTVIIGILTSILGVVAKDATTVVKS